MKRVFDMEVLRCPYRHSRRERIARVAETPVIRAFLKCFGLPPDPLELKPVL